MRRTLAATLSYQDRVNVAPSATYTTPLLNTIGFSRVTVVLTQRGVGSVPPPLSHTGQARLFGVVASFTESGPTPYGALRLVSTIIVGAIGAPETYTTHWGFRMLQLVIDAPDFADGELPQYNFDLNIFGSGSS